ncbi:hypothetical protein K491DRAFT_759067 [Lophiostoma macrostomum CBS 122681]|uniref:Uncharacterized protein n=1 Tax=Lophiostoma macrostomum CBS 122681 TaxID=1314788 RepID=A0A6A6T358_9PLEO|nr:hypothetical protein K491DRAFT_759067 [Lophiostoma macrostomum CBS 122681]
MKIDLGTSKSRPLSLSNGDSPVFEPAPHSTPATHLGPAPQQTSLHLHTFSSRVNIARCALHSVLLKLNDEIGKVSTTHVLNTSATSLVGAFHNSKNLGMIVFAREQEVQRAMSGLRDFVHDAVCRIRGSCGPIEEVGLVVQKYVMLEQEVRNGICGVAGGGFGAGEWVGWKMQRLENAGREQGELEGVLEGMLSGFELPVAATFKMPPSNSPTITEAHQTRQQHVPSNLTEENPLSTYTLLSKTYPTTRLAYDGLTASITDLRTTHLNLLTAASLAKEEKRLHGYSEEKCDQARSRCEQSFVLEFLPSRLVVAEECSRELVRHWKALGQLVEMYDGRRNMSIERGLIEVIGRLVDSAGMVVKRTEEMVAFAREQRWEVVMRE